MKQFNNYQLVDGEPMSKRDKQAFGSKFWNKGKWDNFVLPLLPDNCKDMTLIDVGCNAGLFLKLAEDKGFRTVIGIDENKEAVRRGVAYCQRNGGSYEIRLQQMEDCIDTLPVADYTILANTHYYFFIQDWLNYLDKLAAKTRYCIIVTATKREDITRASAATDDIKEYFKYWSEMGSIPELFFEDDPFPRQQWSFCFKSPLIERVPLDKFSYVHPCYNDYFKELDNRIDPLKTEFYKFIKDFRKTKWSEGRIVKYVCDLAVLYKDVKENGVLQPIILNSKNKIFDGAHRYAILRYLRYNSALVRRVL